MGVPPKNPQLLLKPYTLGPLSNEPKYLPTPISRHTHSQGHRRPGGLQTQTTKSRNPSPPCRQHKPPTGSTSPPAHPAGSTSPLQAAQAPCRQHKPPAGSTSPLQAAQAPQPALQAAQAPQPILQAAQAPQPALQAAQAPPPTLQAAQAPPPTLQAAHAVHTRCTHWYRAGCTYRAYEIHPLAPGGAHVPGIRDSPTGTGRDARTVHTRWSPS